MMIKLMLILIVGLISRVELSQDVMKNMSINFAKPLEACRTEVRADFKPTNVLRMISHTFGTQVLACQKESKFSRDIISEFVNYWNASIGLNDPNMGCVIMCTLDKLELLDAGGSVLGPNAEAFAVASGSDENTSKALTELFQMCRRGTHSTEPCELALNIARCFRAGIYMLEWTPNLKDPVPNFDY